MSLRAFARDERGAVAIMAALLLPVLIGAGALAVDVGHGRLVANRLQSSADAAALAAVQSLGDQRRAATLALEYARLNTPASFGTTTGPADVEFGSYDPAERTFAPSTENVNAIRVWAVREPARGNAAPRFLSAIFGSGGLSVRVSAIAARTITSVYDAPELFDLAPEAGDYNEVYAYCFNFAGGGTAESRRSRMTLIARNLFGAVAYEWPECAPGESLSFRLRNIRGGRNDRTRIAAPDREEHNHYSDTVLVDGRETYDFAGRSILETVRCDTMAECTGVNRGGVVPVGRGRTPALETRPCVPGKFMYYGWEDRPPGLGWTDTDYDDIVFVMRCPTGRDVAYGASRLVR